MDRLYNIVGWSMRTSLKILSPRNGVFYKNAVDGEEIYDVERDDHDWTH
jgi:hypothetical protein